MRKYITIFLLTFSICSAYAQNISVSGTVLDKKTGEPLIGAIVVETGTNNQNGTITDFDGKFTLDVAKKQASLTINFIGYKPQEIAINNATTLNIRMDEDSQVLGEVVVVGYGTQKKESVVGSISSIKGEALVAVPASNLTQSIVGKTTGVAVIQSSGEIGRDEASIFIRGKATFSDQTAQPLIVVDGIIRESFAQIDPNEIESFNVLKDASATAVFGVKGANGVIIITTKRGITGKPQVSLTAQYAFNVPMRLHTPMGSYRSALLRNEMDSNGGKQPQYSASDLMKYRTGVSPYTHPDINWVDEIMKSYSTQQQYNVNIRGGANTTRYFVSAGFFGQDSPFKGDDITKFNRYNFRTNLDIDITKDLTASINLGARIEDRRYPTSMQYSSWNIYHDAFSMSGRQLPAYNMDGSYAGNEQYGNLHARIQDSGEFNENRNILEVGVNLQYKLDWLLKGLSVRGQVAYDDNSKHGKIYEKSVALYEYQYSTDTYKEFYQNRPLHWSWQYVDNYSKIYGEAGLNYALEFDKHNINGLLLFNRLSYGYNTDPEYATEGIVGRLEYGYDSKYMAEFNVGYNGSENFAKGKRYDFFPAFAIGWMLSNEKFIKDNTALNKIIYSLKLRASLGWVGNDRSWIGSTERRFIYLPQYNYMNDESSYVFGVGDNLLNGIRQGNIANPDATWEKSRKLNIGLESSFFNGMFGINFDYFREKRKNILSELLTIPDYVGAISEPANIGVVENKGFELDLTHNNQINKDLSYFAKGNFSFARNKIIEKGTPRGILPYQREEGYSIGTPLKYITIGYFQDYEDIENSPSQLGIDGNTEVRPGDLKYKDVNQDGVIDRYDQVRTGYPLIPEIQYGLTLGGSYKGFDISILFQGVTNVSFDKNWEAMWAFSNGDNVYEKHWYYWTPESGDSRSKYTELYGKYQNNEAGADYTLSDGSYIRLKNIDIGYTIPAHITKKIGISNVRVYASALNVHTWSKEPYLDPDNRNNRGANMPPVQSFNMGVNINF